MARTFNPAQHPRDRFGRFTKSRTVKASATDRKAAREVAEQFAPKQLSRQERGTYLQQIASRQPEGAFADVLEANRALRSGRDSDAAKRVDAAMTELPDDVLLSRAVPLSAFGNTDPASLAGMKVRDAGFAPTQFGAVRPAGGQVRMHIAAPAGTKAAVNPDTGEVVLDRDTEMVVAKVAKNEAGGHDMWLTVLPKQGAKPRVADNGKKADIQAPGVADNNNKTDMPGDDAGRADLMKLKAPELRERMRERGLKPGRMRKSQMVDALVADETGDRQAKGTADSSAAGRVTGSDRVDAVTAGALSYFVARPSGPWDESLQKIVNEQGFDAPPLVGDPEDLDAKISDGWVEVWRGVVDSPTATAGQQLDEFRTGEFRPGKGIYGNGMYTSTRLETAEEYGIGGAVVRLAVDPGARIVDHADLMKEFKAWKRTLPNRGQSTINQLLMLPTTDADALLKVLANDEGRFAAARGYDVIRVSRRDDGATNYKVGQRQADQYVVLNRSAVMVEA
ncbi:hypothetical protein [Paractinoplanes maris]|uniref:hypothetical protein n=1 Tax=Paractinoplanes maris TaxID=1734446 RepID=UPI0020208CD0|nr:hypothetical protein [Actinoplanes maris]